MATPALDPDIVTREILTALRGTEAQIHLSRRLGYTFNQVYRWESGQTRMPWGIYLRLAALKGADVKTALWCLIDYRGSAEDTAAITRALVRDMPLLEASQKSGHSRFQIGRWLSGNSEPSLRCVIAMILSLSSRYLEVLSAMVPNAKLPSLTPLLLRRDRQLSVSYDFPFAPALIGWLQMRRYADVEGPSDTWLAERLGLDQATVQQALVALTEAEIIRPSPTVPGKYDFSGAMSIASGRDRRRFMHNAAYWFEKAAATARRIRSSKHKSTFAYLSLPVTAATRRTIIQKAATFFEEVKSLAEASPLEEADEVLLLNFALLSTDENPAAFQEVADDPFFR